VTDPPYYDNVPYSDLSDFFYVWLRLAIGEEFPELFKTLLTPKADELVADPVRQGGVDESERFFRDGYNRVFSRIRKDTSESYPISVFYGFKQSESNEDGHASTGWETLLVLQPHLETISPAPVVEPAGAGLVAAPPA